MKFLRSDETCSVDWYEEYKNYLENLYYHVRIHSAVAHEYIEHVAKWGNKVLEVGSGSGIDMVILKTRYPEKIVYVSDIDRRLCIYLKKLVNKANVEIKVLNCSATNIPFSNQSFDVICSQGLFEHYDNYWIKEALKEQKRVAKTVIIDVPTLNRLRIYGKPRKDLGERWLSMNEWIRIITHSYPLKDVYFRDDDTTIGLII